MNFSHISLQRGDHLYMVLGTSTLAGVREEARQCGAVSFPRGERAALQEEVADTGKRPCRPWRFGGSGDRRQVFA